MKKLGYTFYPKDWQSDEAVFELNLEERGFYRELIDLAMLNDNKTEIKTSVWTRKYATDINTLQTILSRLESLKLINIDEVNNTLFIHSCEKRLQLVRGGRNGGLKSKPPVKPEPKQIEKKVKVKENVYRAFAHLSITKEECNKLYKAGYTITEINDILDSVENFKNNKNYKSLYLTAKKWLEREHGKRKVNPATERPKDKHGNPIYDFGDNSKLR